jgi:hypothetical protein
MIAGAAEDRVVPANLTCGRVRRPPEGDCAVPSINLKGHRRAEDEAARRERSRCDRSRTEARRFKSSGSGERKATLRLGAALSNIDYHIEGYLTGRREGTARASGDGRQLDAGYVAVIAIGTATVDGIRPSEGGVGDGPGEGSDLSSNRRGGQGDVAASQGPSQADGGELIKTIGTVDMRCDTYRSGRLTDAARDRQRGGPRDCGRQAELPIPCNVQEQRWWTWR